MAELDTLEARQALTLLRVITLNAPAGERRALLLDLLTHLASQRTSLRNRFVELTRYEARTETNERLAGVMLVAAQVTDDYKRAPSRGNARRRYEARTETNERLAGVMLVAAQVTDDYKRARKAAA